MRISLTNRMVLGKNADDDCGTATFEKTDEYGNRVIVLNMCSTRRL